MCTNKIIEGDPY